MFRKPLSRTNRIEQFKRTLFLEETVAKQIAQGEVPDCQSLELLSECYDALAMKPESRLLKAESAKAAIENGRISRESGFNEIEWD